MCGWSFALGVLATLATPFVLWLLVVRESRRSEKDSDDDQDRARFWH